MKTLFTIVKVMLGSVLVLYSYAKFSGAQFPKFEIHESAGELDPVALVFYFYGYSQTYMMFCAVAELLIGLMVIIPQTSRFGLLAYFAFTLNIAVLDWSFDFALETRLLITSLCIISLLLIIADRKKIVPIIFQPLPAASESKTE